MILTCLSFAKQTTKKPHKEIEVSRGSLGNEMHCCCSLRERVIVKKMRRRILWPTKMNHVFEGFEISCKSFLSVILDFVLLVFLILRRGVIKLIILHYGRKKEVVVVWMGDLVSHKMDKKVLFWLQDSCWRKKLEAMIELNKNVEKREIDYLIHQLLWLKTLHPKEWISLTLTQSRKTARLKRKWSSLWSRINFKRLAIFQSHPCLEASDSSSDYTFKTDCGHSWTS
jgi:hypothetical protein